MEDKLICAMLSNIIKDVTFSHDNFWLKTKKDYIGIIKNQKYNGHFVWNDDIEGNFFSRPTYAEQCKYIQEWTSEKVKK